jgi:hypothetical protein
MSPTHRPTRRSLAAAWLAGSVLALSLNAQQVAPPPAAPAEEPVVQLDRFTVTGTNIRRVDQEKSLPVTVLDQQALEARDAGQASDLLTSLSQVTGLPGNETATLGATARGDNATVSLRGIPSSNTLVLLNGRRLPPHPISQSEAGVPTLSTNVNQLPNRGLERIDVLRDGASSIYGTDAVAGVINYLTRRSFVGTELQVRYGQTNHGDGQEYRATLTHGLTFGDGKGRGLVTVDYYDRAAMFARDRAFSAEADNTYRAPAPWNVSTNTDFNARSATTAFGNFSTGTVTGGVFTASRPAGVPGTLVSTAGTFFLVPTATRRGLPDDHPEPRRRDARLLLEQQRLSRHPAAVAPPQRLRQRRIRPQRPPHRVRRPQPLPRRFPHRARARRHHRLDRRQHHRARQQSLEPLRRALLVPDRRAQHRRHRPAHRHAGGGAHHQQAPHRSRRPHGRRAQHRLPRRRRRARQALRHLDLGERGCSTPAPRRPTTSAARAARACS